MPRTAPIPLAALLCALAAGRASTSPVVPDSTSADAAPEKQADAAALAAPEPVILGETFVVPSKILGERRRISIWTPPGEAGEDPSLPVLYTTDGDRNFALTVGIVRALSSVGSIPAMKVVGLHHPDRGKDLTPYHEPQAPRKINGAQYLRYVVDEVIPLVEGPERRTSVRILLGHSLGGLFDAYALLHAPEAFDVFIAVAPALAWGDGELFREAESLLPALPAGPRVVSLSTAELDGPLALANAERFIGLTTRLGPDGLRVAHRTWAGDDHWTVLPKALTTGLRDAFPLIAIDAAFKAAAEGGIEALQAWHAAALDAAGPRARLRATDVNLAGYAYLADERPEEAVAVFTLLTRLFPKEANSYDSLGEGLQALGDRAGAEAAFQRAVDLAAEDDPNLPVFKAHLEQSRASAPGR